MIWKKRDENIFSIIQHDLIQIEERGHNLLASPVASVPSLFSRRCLMSVQGGPHWKTA
jgi:hypothetical protein